MKRKLCAWALVVSMFFILATPVSSVDAEAGFYHVGTAPGVTVEPRSAAGPVRAVSRNVDGIYGDETFYPGADRFKVTLSGVRPGDEYILTVTEPATGTILYIDQRIGARTLAFDVAFRLPEERTDLLLSVGSTAEGGTKITVPLSYTPAADGTVCSGGDACPMTRYSDLNADAWYHDGVHWALEAGVMNGMGAETFAPDRPVTRAMLVTMLWRLEGRPGAAGDMSFADVEPGRWYTEAVRWAAGTGIVKGYNHRTFGPDDALTREQLAVILWRYAGRHGEDVTSGVVDRLGAFLDAEKLSPWALDAMRWAVHTGIVKGVDAETLSPKTGATRAQTASMLLRWRTAIPDG